MQDRKNNIVCRDGEYAYPGDRICCIYPSGKTLVGILDDVTQSCYRIKHDDGMCTIMSYDDTLGFELIAPGAPEEVQHVEHTAEDIMVEHPPHYQSDGGLEVIDVIEAFTADLKGIEATDTGNVIKYICRWKHKNGLQDLEKARWYLSHLINRVKKNNKKEND